MVVSSPDEDDVLTDREEKLHRHRDLMLETIRRHILPVFSANGFETVPRDPIGSNFVDIFPFGQFGGIDQMEGSTSVKFN